MFASFILGGFAKHRGNEVKRQLVRATIAAMHAIRETNPSALKATDRHVTREAEAATVAGYS